MIENLTERIKRIASEEKEILRIFYIDTIKLMIISGALVESLFFTEVIQEAQKKYLKEPDRSADLFLKIIEKTAQKLIEKSSKTKVDEINAGIANTFLGTARTLFDKYREFEDFKFNSDLDELTGLPERKTLEEDFVRFSYNEEERRRSLKNREVEKDTETEKNKIKPFSFILIDLDNFKKINDEHGHLAGDQILKQIADDFKHILRTDDRVYRWAGDEFVFLSKGTEEEVRKLLERLTENFNSKKFEIQDNKGETKKIKITMSIGSVLSEKDGRENWTLDDFIKLADKALYKVKESGRNSFIQA